MLTKQEVEQMRKNAKIHKKIFDEIKAMIGPWVKATQVDKLCWEIAKKHWVLCGFRGVYGFPANICISVNDVVVHGLPREDLVFQEWDLVTFDFGIKDRGLKINTDAAFSVIIGGDDKNPEGARLIEANKQALYAWIAAAKVGNTIGDIGYAIQQVITNAWYKVVKDLTGHAIGKKLHEKPYVYNFGTPGSGPKLKKWMTLAIEPILGQSSWEIADYDDWEIYIKDGSLGSQYEHTILITDSEAEIII